MLTRKSSGCVVYKKENKLIKILMVTASEDRNKWVLPKGGVEMHLSDRESAAKEVYEESGAVGVPGRSLGSVKMYKNGMMHDIEIFAMPFDHYADRWPENEIRDRWWFESEHAMERIDPYMAPLLWTLIEGLTANMEHEAREERLGRNAN